MGKVLVENIFLGQGTAISDLLSWNGISTASELTDPYTQYLLEISSPIPASYRSVMQEFGYKLAQEAKMFFPANYVGLVELGFAMSGATPITVAKDDVDDAASYEEQVRATREKVEREAIERAKREVAEKAAKEKEEREVAEWSMREKAEREFLRKLHVKKQTAKQRKR